MSTSLDFAQRAYLAITLSSSSPFLTAPSTLTSLHPSLSFIGQVGQLQDVQLVSVPKSHWEENGNEIVMSLRNAEGVVNVEFQQEKRRVKRGGDEL